MTTAAELVSQAKQRITNLHPAQVATELESGDVVLVDMREPGELEQTGVVGGAVHAPRGMLEFWADPTSPYHRAEFDPERRTVLYCASGAAPRWLPRPCSNSATRTWPTSTAGSKPGSKPVSRPSPPRTPDRSHQR